MTSRIYKSAQGKMVDMGALSLKNENQLAVSPGTKVNARGDKLNTENRVVDNKATQVQRNISQTVQSSNITDEQIFSNSSAAKAAASKRVETPVVETPVVETPVVKKEVVETPVVKKEVVETPVEEDTFELLDPIIEELSIENPIVTQEPVVVQPSPTSNEGLAAAIARAKNKKVK